MDILRILLQATISFVSLFIISKILGRKQIAQLEFTDYVIGISLGSIAANMVMEPDIPFYHFIIGMLVFTAIDYAISIASRKGLILKKLFIGRPLVIIEKGELNYKNLKKSKLEISELVAQCRIAGYFNLSEIYYCVFETNGTFSIMPTTQAQQPKLKDLKVKKTQAQMHLALVVDGKMLKKHLLKVNKTQQWLEKELNIFTKEDLKNILLANYDPVKKEFSVFLKNKKTET